MQIDYEVLRTPPRGGPDGSAARRRQARRDQRLRAARARREAKPQVVDIDAFTIQNIFEILARPPARQTVALINVGASLSSLNIVSRRGVERFTRDIANGGNFITEEIQKRLGVSVRAGRGVQVRQRRSRAHRPAHRCRRSSRRCIDSIAGEIQRSLDFFLATSGEAEIAASS